MRVGAVVDPAPQLLGLAQQPVVALGPAGVVLALVAAVAGVRADRRPQPGDLGVVGRAARALAAAAAGPWSGTLARSVEARSRRACGLRGLNDLGIRSRSSASTGDGKSTTESRAPVARRSAPAGAGRRPSPDDARVEHDRPARRCARPARG